MAVVVDIDHEAGDLSEYTSVTTNPDLQAHANAALGQTSYGMRCYINDTDTMYGQANFTPGASYVRFRFYVDINTLTIPSGVSFPVLLVSGSSGIIVEVHLNWNGSAYRVRLRSIEDDESATSTYVVATDAEHYIEVLITRGAGTGAHQMWIDGVSSATHSSLNNDTKFDGITNCKMGVLYPSSGISGYLYLDELIVRNDNTAIGPNATTTSTTTTGGTTTTGASTTTLSGSGSTSTITISSTVTTTTTTGTTTATTTTGTTTSAAPTTIKLRDGPGGHTARAAVGDRLVVRSLDSGGTWRETWVQVLSVTDPGGGATYFEYSIERKSGDAVSHPEGATVVNYGAGSGGMVRVVGEE